MGVKGQNPKIIKNKLKFIKNMVKLNCLILRRLRHIGCLCLILRRILGIQKSVNLSPSRGLLVFVPQLSHMCGTCGTYIKCPTKCGTYCAITRAWFMIWGTYEVPRATELPVLNCTNRWVVQNGAVQNGRSKTSGPKQVKKNIFFFLVHFVTKMLRKCSINPKKSYFRPKKSKK